MGYAISLGNENTFRSLARYVTRPSFGPFNSNYVSYLNMGV